MDASIIFEGFAVSCLLFCLLRFAHERWRRSRRISFTASGKSKQKAVLITGCDTGFGRMLAERFGTKGIRTYAGCLLSSSVEELKKLGRNDLVPFSMDVTSDASVSSALTFIGNDLRTNKAELYALVNNAGIIKGSLIDLTVMKSFYDMMEVNYFGLVRTTKAFLPLLKQTKGRVVNVASIAGRVSAMTLGAYAATKHAVEAFSDALRQEMKPFGVLVSIIEPGFTKTPLVANAEKTVRQGWESAPPEIREEYGQECLDVLLQSVTIIQSRSSPPEPVVDALEDAVTTVSPRTRYLVGADAKYIWVWIDRLPTAIGDLFVYLGPQIPIKALQQKAKAV